MLSILSLQVAYDEVQVIWGASFLVPEKSITALIGSNGAGKSTILNTVAGLVRPTSGTLSFEERDLAPYSAFQRVALGLSLVPEGRRLFPFLTVQENLEIGAFPKRARAESRSTMDWVFQLFPILAERRRLMAGMLSGGEQQMLAIGRGLMSRPKLLMLDEPSLGLAPTVVLMLYDLIQEINRAGVTILLVEQNIEFCLQIASTAYVLETGRITLKGTGKELLENDQVKRAYLGL